MRDSIVRLLEAATSDTAFGQLASDALAGLTSAASVEFSVTRPIPKDEVLEIYRRRERHVRKAGQPETNAAQVVALLERANAQSFLICSFSLGSDTFLVFLYPNAESVAAILRVREPPGSP